MPTRVPKGPKTFDNYIKRVVNFLLTLIPNSPTVKWWQNLGLVQAEMTQLQAYLTEWLTGNPAAPGAYELHSNAYGITKNEATTKEVGEIIVNFSEYIAPLLTRMDGSSNMTPTIRLLMNIGEPNPHHVKHTDEITQNCYAKVISTTGEKVQLKCSDEANSKRPCMLKDEGSIEIQVTYSVKPPSIDSTGRVVPPVSPVGPTDTTLAIWETSTKASFFLQEIPAGSTGKILQGFSRWADIHNMKRRGPWTPLPPTQIN